MRLIVHIFCPPFARFTCKPAIFISAPGRIRTCDRRIRSPLLCPLSYGRIRLIYAEFSPPGSSRKPLWQQCGSNSARNARSQRIVHCVGQAAVHTLDDVRVGIEGDVYAGVAQESLDVLWVLACHEEYCSAGVPKIMDPYVNALLVDAAIPSGAQLPDSLRLTAS